MRKFFFYLSIVLLLGWTAIIWLSFFASPSGVGTGQPGLDEGTYLMMTFFVWALGFIVLGIVALIAKPR